ncbi:DUF542 domain-containing protein [Gimesia benthica]
MTLRDRVGDGISNHPAISRIIEQHLIEYYCRGERSLKEACRSAQVDTETIPTAKAPMAGHHIQ